MKARRTEQWLEEEAERTLSAYRCPEKRKEFTDAVEAAAAEDAKFSGLRKAKRAERFLKKEAQRTLDIYRAPDLLESLSKQIEIEEAAADSEADRWMREFADSTMECYREPAKLDALLTKIEEAKAEKARTEAFAAQQNSKTSASAVLRRLTAAVAVFVAFAAALFCGFYFGMPNQETSKVEYFKENRVFTEASLSELQSVLGGLKLSESYFTGNSDQSNITRCYDSLSGDTLYYDLMIKDKKSLSNFQIKAVTNPNYDDNFDLDQCDRRAAFYGFYVLYQIDVAPTVALGVYEEKASAFFGVGSAKIFVDYSRLKLDQTEDFLEDLNSLFVSAHES